jgi:hypothetical protein
MIYLYYSDSKEKDLVDGWAKYGNKMGFTTITGDMGGWNIVSSDCGSALQYCTSTDKCVKNVSYDNGLLYSWTPIKSNYIVDPLQLEAKHRKVKQIIKFKPI